MGVREGPDAQVCTRNLVPTTEIFGQSSRSHDAWRFSVEQSEILNTAHIQENEVLLFLSFETEITRGDVQAKRKKRRFPSPLRLHRDTTLPAPLFFFSFHQSLDIELARAVAP